MRARGRQDYGRKLAQATVISRGDLITYPAMTLSSAVDAPSVVNVIKTSPVKPIGTVHFPPSTGANWTGRDPVANAQNVAPSAVALFWSASIRVEPPAVVWALLMTNEGNA